MLESKLLFTRNKPVIITHYPSAPDGNDSPEARKLGKLGRTGRLATSHRPTLACLAFRDEDYNGRQELCAIKINFEC